MLLGFKLSPLDSNSVVSGYATLILPPGMGGWASGILPQRPSAFLGRGHKASVPPGDPPSLCWGGSRAAQGPYTPSPAGLPPHLWMDRTSSIVILAIRPPRPQTSSLILSFKRTQQTPHFPNGVSNCARVPNTSCSESPPDSSVSASNSRIFPS